MFLPLPPIRHRLAFKLILSVGIVLLVSMSIWALVNIGYQKQKAMDNIISGIDRLTTTIRLGTHYAMMLNSRDDINQIITNIGRQKEIENIRLYNKAGRIKFSNQGDEVEVVTDIEDEACFVCHRSDPPLIDLNLTERVRIFSAPEGHRLLGIISPIPNEPGCATGECHFHPQDKQILGALDLVVSLAAVDQEIHQLERGILGQTLSVFICASAILFIFVLRFVNHPIQRLIAGTRAIARGEYGTEVAVRQVDEMGLLADAINHMGSEIDRNHAKLNKQRKEYQNLFEQVPCLITVQDRHYRLLNYNREFARRFAPQAGDFCYKAYKGRDDKCKECPVEKTFRDGKSYATEESGINKDGTDTHWIVKTSPIFDDAGRIVAAMEISLDITERRHLEIDLERSERKYHATFNNIPNPVFVLDKESFRILDANRSVAGVYGLPAEELVGHSFLELFAEDERDHFAFKLATATVINQARQSAKSGKPLSVNIRVSPSEYAGHEVLLVTISDITKRLEAEQQLIQASKMATLGEMATGIAHELNQPLSVIKTASSFCMRKFHQGRPLDATTLQTLLEKMDSNADRATKIIHHMRQFARKAETALERIHLHAVLASAFEIFSQQLKVRGIEVIWQTAPDLPKILADPGRLEQVFINLLINARDAIAAKPPPHTGEAACNQIVVTTWLDAARACVYCRICDTGIGLPAGKADRLFEPFFTTKEPGKGTGLGLSISYGIVKECGGTIQAMANEGGGACLVLEFPVPGTTTLPADEPNDGRQPAEDFAHGRRLDG
ncbi:MAG: PAS domain S-box protein [Desulfosarcinaceae bacterium]|nr:PAS domain S-box protein [Desulfosarcinaceae bacterium]